MKTLFCAFTLSLVSLAAAAAAAAADNEYKLVIKDHTFSPAEITIPADTKVKFTIDNQDATPEEFESYELHREKIIPGSSKGVVFLGPLKPGTYKYFGDFHQDAAQGVIIVK